MHWDEVIAVFIACSSFFSDFVEFSVAQVCVDDVPDDLVLVEVEEYFVYLDWIIFLVLVDEKTKMVVPNRFNNVIFALGGR